MRAKELQDWFPEARISDQPVEKEGYLTLPLASHSGFCWRKLGSASVKSSWLPF